MQYTVNDFDYDCPPRLIAQHPAATRDGSRLLVLRGAQIAHRQFADFPELVEAGDVIVVNTSKVIKARLRGIRENGRPAEILLVHPEPDGSWLAMGHPGGKLKPGRKVTFGDDATLIITGMLGGGMRRVTLQGDMEWTDLMEAYGEVPLPPYIERAPDAADTTRYQTVFAQTDGSVAAPTAGLHFTDSILERIRARGGSIAEAILHVGPGTFKPVQTDSIEEHRMHREWFSLPQKAVDTIKGAKQRGGRVWAIGTTVTRILETVAQDGELTATSGWTSLFIYPPYEFKVVDCLFTNFHLPRSTLLMLVCAFGGYERVMNAYREAVAERYRFYSYGDAMVIL